MKNTLVLRWFKGNDIETSRREPSLLPMVSMKLLAFKLKHTSDDQINFPKIFRKIYVYLSFEQSLFRNKVASKLCNFLIVPSNLTENVKKIWLPQVLANHFTLMEVQNLVYYQFLEFILKISQLLQQVCNLIFWQFINSQYFWKWTNANPMKFFGRAATASNLYIRLKLSLG